MAISTPVKLTDGGSTTDQTSFTTAAVTNTSGAVVLVAVSNRKTTPLAPTISGFTELTSFLDNNGTSRVTVLYAVNPGLSSATLTIDFGAGQTQTSVNWSVVEVASGYDSTIANWQVATASVGTDNTAETTFSVAPASDSCVFAIGGGSSQNAWTPETGFTELTDRNQATNSCSLFVHYQNGSSPPTTVVTDQSGSATWGQTLIEVKVPANTAIPLALYEEC